MDKKITQKAKVNNTIENFNICTGGNCDTCPSYSGHKGEGLFCARGPSETAVEKRGCNCPECPVWISNSLSSMYYCVNPGK